MASKCGPILELAGVEQRLVVARQSERITAFFGCRSRLRFPGDNGVPREHLNDGRSV
jgi:hypothetical protein